MSYTTPGGVALGEVIGLRHDHAAGIATKQNNDGTWELTAWPAGLGARPTQNDINTWATEATTRRATERRAQVKAALRENEADAIRLRAVVKVVMTSLVEARTTCNALRDAMVNATSLADLKARATTVAALTNRTFAQALTAVEQLVDAGQGEE